MLAVLDLVGDPLTSRTSETSKEANFVSISIIPKPEEGYCQCGCGDKTRIAKKTRSSIGHVKGRHTPYINGHNRKKGERYRVEDRGYKTACWTWLLGKSQWGYGLECVEGVTVSAHRASYEREIGKILNGSHLDHLCRNRDCVNPEHLEPVTSAVNIQRGDLTTLKESEVISIRKLAELGNLQKDIAKVFNTTPGNVSAIVNRKSWRNIL
jgi:hypothetical protein